MDSDGYIDKNGNCDFSQKSEKIIFPCKELLESIGIKTFLTEIYKKLPNSNQKNKYWNLSFTTNKPIFKLKRHLNRLKYDVRKTVTKRYIKEINKIESVPTQCICVDSESHLFLCGESFIPTHNSAVARTVIDYLTVNKGFNSYLMSSTKMLQNQYYDESLLFNKFNLDYQVGKGRNNFECKWNGNNCGEGECKITSNTQFRCKYGLHDADEWDIGCLSGCCPYWEQKKDAIFSDVCILNYDVLLSDFPHHYKFRNLMVCDEAHNLDTKIMNRVSITLSETKLGEYGVFLENEDFYEKNTTVSYWVDRLKEIKEILVKHHAEGSYEENMRTTYFTTNQLNDINHLIDKIDARLEEIESNPLIWFIDIVDDKYGKKVTIKPIDIHQYAKPYLLDKSDYHLLMSGSIVDYHNFAKYLGLEDDEVYYIEQESSFDVVNNNPLIPKYCGKLTYKEKQKTLPKAYTVIDEILDKHYNDKGIIHCNSREFANKIFENCDDYGRFIIYENSFEKEEAIEFLKDSSNGVIVAYSLEEGLNLPNDDIRFQVLLKCPYPSLADKQIKARQKADYTWYLLETIRKLIQTVGRGMRNEDDYCKNYLIDTSFKNILKNKYCPQYLKDSVQKKISINGVKL